MTAPLIERLGWTLVHSVWQMAALALLLMLLLRLLASGSPRARYNSAALTLLAMAGSLPLTFYLQPASTAADGAASAGQGTAATGNRSLTLRVGQLDSESQATTGRTAPTLPEALPRWLAWRNHLRSLIQPWLATLVAAWALGATFASLRPLAGWRAMRRLRTEGTSPAPPEVLALARRAAKCLGIARSVEIVQSTLVQVPGVVGWLSPLILLPAGIASGLTPAQLEAILAHELAHVRRQDYLMNVLQTLAETLLFYHPAVWWVSQQMRLEREDCCDDLALAVCPDRGQFARALLALAELRGGLPSPAMAASGGSLLARIRRIVEGTPANYVRPNGLASVAGILACAVALVVAVTPGSAPTMAEEPRSPTLRVGHLDSESQATTAPKDTPPAGTPWVRGVAAQPWFWPDPYSHLGQDDSKGAGWSYVRVALDDRVGEDLGTSKEQRKSLVEIFRRYEERERDLGRKLVEEGQVDTVARLARRQELWLEARNTAREHLTDVQHQRVEQLMIQRKSYNAFRSEQLTARLELTEEQRKKIIAAIDAHLRRIEGNELEFGRTTQRATQALGEESSAARVKEITRVKAHHGRLSHRRVWDEIHEVLSQQQREKFNGLRGPMPESVRSKLHLFDPIGVPPRS